MSMSRLAFLVQALIAHFALGERLAVLISDSEPSEHAVLVKVKTIMSSSGEICGGPEIWNMITGDPSLSGVRNIQWSKIDSIATQHIEEQELRIKLLDHALELLSKRIEEAKSKDDIREMTREQITALIVDGTAPFNGLDEAKRTKCGVPGIRPRPPRRAYYTAEEQFEAKASKVFDGSVKVGNSSFLETCREMLPCEDASTGCYCEQLCQVFKDTAQKASDASTGESAGNTDDLMRQEMENKNELERRKSSLVDCKNSRAQLQVFAEQVEVLKSDISQRHAAVRDAEMALDEAQDDLGDVEEELQSQESAADAALKVLKDEEGKHQEAEEALANLHAKEQDLRKNVTDGLAALESARAGLQQAKEAANTMESLRELVSATMLKMHMLFEKAVSEPLRNLGIDEDLDFGEVFESDPENLPAADTVKTAIKSMHAFCGESQAIFDSVKDKVDLSPLCSFGAASEIKADVVGAVLEAERVVRERLEQIKGWLNPYRGQGNMNKAMAEARYAQGEPAGLREISSAFGQTTFYQYLKDWKLKGKFLELLEALRGAMQDLAKSVEELSDQAESTQQALRETETARQNAEESLRMVAASLEAAQEDKAKVEKSIEELNAKSAKLNADISGLLAQLKEAKRKYQGALDNLLKAHKESTSFVQTLFQRQEAVEALRSRVAQERNLMVSRRIQADKAEQAFRRTAARLADAEEDLEQDMAVAK